MANEFGPRDYNNESGYSNNLKEIENPSVKSNAGTREFHDYSVQKDPVIKKPPRGHKILRSISTVAVTAAA